MESEDDDLFQSGIKSIAKALEVKKETTTMIVSELEETIAKLQCNLSYIKEENERLKDQNSHLKRENEELKKQNFKLITSLELNKSKVQMIKKTVLDNNSLSQSDMNTNNTNCNKYIDENLNSNRTDSSIPLRQDIFHLYKKGAVVPPSYYNNNNSHMMRKTNSNITMIPNDDKYLHIETKINKIKGNLTSRDNSFRNNNTIDYMRVNSNSSMKEIKEYISTTHKYNTPSHRNKVKGRILNGSKTSNSGKRSKKYESINQFLNECNLRLDPQIFEEILSIFESLKGKTTGEEQNKDKIRQLIHESPTLMQMLESVFQNDYSNCV